MRLLGRYGKAFVAGGYAVCITASLLLGPTPSPKRALAATSMQSTFSPLDDVATTEAANLRLALGLDDDVLVALNLEHQALISVLTDFRNWYESNAGNLRVQRQSIANQSAMIAKLRSEIGAGRADTDALRQSESRLAQLVGTFRDTLTEGEARTRFRLDEPRLALIQHMQGQPALGLPFRGFPLTADQEAGRREIVSRYAARVAAAQTEERRSAIQLEFRRELEAAIGPSMTGAMEQAAASYSGSSERLVAALEQVFPPLEMTAP